jgi:hypothetical protein
LLKMITAEEINGIRDALLEPLAIAVVTKLQAVGVVVAPSVSTAPTPATWATTRHFVPDPGLPLTADTTGLWMLGDQPSHRGTYRLGWEGSATPMKPVVSAATFVDWEGAMWAIPPALYGKSAPFGYARTKEGVVLANDGLTYIDRYGNRLVLPPAMSGVSAPWGYGFNEKGIPFIKGGEYDNTGN